MCVGWVFPLTYRYHSSFQEGNDAEAARLAVAQNLNVKLFFDDNDVTSK